MARLIDLSSKIPGWGSDLPLERRPGVPREHAPKHGTGAHWDEPEPQRTSVKIYMTTERSEITPVFGTACPPRGLSGKLRALAYGFTEARLAHWLTLILADRVDVIEGMLSDLRRGRIANPFAEMGIFSELRAPGAHKFFPAHERSAKARLTGVFGLAAGVGAVAYFMARSLSNRAEVWGTLGEASSDSEPGPERLGVA